jgi:hypothetical protein
MFCRSLFVSLSLFLLVIVVARTLLNQVFSVRKLKGKSYDRHHEFGNRYGTSIFTDDKGYIVVATNPSSFCLLTTFRWTNIYHGIVITSSTTGVTSVVGTDYLPLASEFTPVFSCPRVATKFQQLILKCNVDAIYTVIIWLQIMSFLIGWRPNDVLWQKSYIQRAKCHERWTYYSKAPPDTLE